MDIHFREFSRQDTISQGIYNVFKTTRENIVSQYDNILKKTMPEQLFNTEEKKASYTELWNELENDY